MNILLTSAGRRTYLVKYFKEALKGDGLVYASNSVMTYTLTQADEYVITPSIYDNGYVDFLINYCSKKNITAIISLFDIDLPVLAKNKARFLQHNIRVVVSDEDVTAICNDKWKTYQFLKGIGLKQAKTYLSLENTLWAIAQGEVSFPLMLKPRWGMGSIGIFQADDENELLVFYNKIKKSIFATYLKYESGADEDNCVLIQQKIDGNEYGLDVLNDLQGNYVTTIAKRKIAMRAGETDIAQIVDCAPFLWVGEALSKSLRHIANLDVDCFVTTSNDIYVLELNCRFGGQYPFSHNAGVDFPKQIIEWLNGNETQENLIAPRIGVRSCKELNPVVF